MRIWTEGGHSSQYLKSIRRDMRALVRLKSRRARFLGILEGFKCVYLYDFTLKCYTSQMHLSY